MRLPILVSDDLSITRSGSREIVKKILWSEVRAWAMLPPKPGDRSGPTQYLFGNVLSLSWREPDDAQLAGRGIQNNRHLAYHERAAELHALIATRTALALRELGQPKAANMLRA